MSNREIYIFSRGRSKSVIDKAIKLENIQAQPQNLTEIKLV